MVFHLFILAWYRTMLCCSLLHFDNFMTSVSTFSRNEKWNKQLLHRIIIYLLRIDRSILQNIDFDVASWSANDEAVNMFLLKKVSKLFRKMIWCAAHIEKKLFLSLNFV